MIQYDYADLDLSKSLRIFFLNIHFIINIIIGCIHHHLINVLCRVGLQCCVNNYITKSTLGLVGLGANFGQCLAERHRFQPRSHLGDFKGYHLPCNVWDCSLILSVSPPLRTQDVDPWRRVEWENKGYPPQQRQPQNSLIMNRNK